MDLDDCNSTCDDIFDTLAEDCLELAGAQWRVNAGVACNVGDACQVETDAYIACQSG